MKFHVTVTSRLTETYGAIVDADSDAEAAEKVNVAISANPHTTQHIHTLEIDGQNIDLNHECHIDEEIIDTSAERVEAQG
jgi:hypothetical protein